VSTNGQPITVIKRGARHGGSRPTRSLEPAGSEYKENSEATDEMLRGREDWPKRKFQIPKTKIQINSKIQIPNKKQTQRGRAKSRGFQLEPRLRK
jgi:hypothetical protein